MGCKLPAGFARWLTRSSWCRPGDRFGRAYLGGPVFCARPQMQSLLVRDAAAVENAEGRRHRGTLRVNGQALRAIFRPVRAGACVGFGTDRTVSTAASGCEGSHTNGRIGDGLVWRTQRSWLEC